MRQRKAEGKIREGLIGRKCLIDLKTYRVILQTRRFAIPAGAECGSPEEVEAAARAICARLDADKEHFVLLALDNKNRLNGYKVISTGTLTLALVHPREVWRAALYLCAANVVFVHNHPSGDPEPSPEDFEITSRLKNIGEVLGIRALDHVVLGDGRYYSFNERGRI